MAKTFRDADVRAEAVYSDSEIRRHEALAKLDSGELEVLFSVDLFNEGTDLPVIDTVLTLRPTQSKILFLQQLGRGLRLHKDKSHLVVIDFIGNHRSFLIKPAALFQQPSFREAVSNAASREAVVPDGCIINYDLESIDLLERMVQKQRSPKERLLDKYEDLALLLGYRPTAEHYFYHLEGSEHKL